MNKLKAYSMDFASFLLENIDAREIRNIILFGSVARDEADIDSDVDLFIDLVSPKKKLEEQINATLDKYYKTVKYTNYWRLKGIDNQISLKIGDLNEWKDLKNSIISNGITLYGKFKDTPNGAEHKTLFSWRQIKPESKRISLSKKLFGRKEKKKFYEGLLQKYAGRKISTGSILVPDEHANIFISMFKSMKIAVEIRKIVEYT
ncbi:nucleotidyltransferase domain-containing protein [Candidatus Woesearchaeota archaeon]|nr:nucleotidyltransferase domain-containing protein [Candidatus Woesearchaeota archaeon]